MSSPRSSQSDGEPSGRSRFLSLELVENKTSRYVHERVKQALSKLPGTQRYSLTFDNGSEFARCHLVEKSHHTRLYFAEPGCPHQRGTKENTNGLIRQFFPTEIDFRTVPPQEMRRVETLMNDRQQASAYTRPIGSAGIKIMQHFCSARQFCFSTTVIVALVFNAHYGGLK